MKKISFLLVAVLLGMATISCSLVTSLTRSDALKFSPDTLPDGQVGQSYQAVITLSNQRTPAFEISVHEDSMPPGLTGTFDQDRQTYTLSGTPTEAGTYSLPVTALCYGTNVSGQSGYKEYQLVIK